MPSDVMLELKKQQLENLKRDIQSYKGILMFLEMGARRTDPSKGKQLLDLLDETRQEINKIEAFLETVDDPFDSKVLDRLDESTIRLENLAKRFRAGAKEGPEELLN